MADRPACPRHPGAVPLREMVVRGSQSGDPATQASVWVVEALEAVEVETVADLVRCEWAPCGGEDGAWVMASNAFLARAGVAEQDKAGALRAFWDALEDVYVRVLDACAGEGRALKTVETGTRSTSKHGLQMDLLQALAVPRDMAQYLPSPVELARRGEVVHVAGVRGSGRSTLLLNSLVRTLWVNETERALWIAVPWADEASRGDGDTGRLRARASIATRGTRIKDAILGHALEEAQSDASASASRKRKRAEEDGSPEDAGRQPASSSTDVLRHLEAHDPTQRLLIDSVSSVEELVRALDQIYPASSRGGPAPPETLVLDGLDRLFLDADGRVLRRFSDSVAVAVERVLYTLAHLGAEHEVRVYLLNGAVRMDGFASVFPTAYGPALWGALRDNVHRTLWLTGDTVFALEDESQAGGGAGDADARRTRWERGLRARVVELHGRGAVGAQWGVYASDGTVLYD